MFLRCCRFVGRSWQHPGPSRSSLPASSEAHSQLKRCPPLCSGLHDGVSSLQNRMLQSGQQPSSRPLRIGNDKPSPVNHPPCQSRGIDPSVAGSESDARAEGSWTTSQNHDEHSTQDLVTFRPLPTSKQSPTAGKDSSCRISSQDVTSSPTFAPFLRRSYVSPAKLAKVRKYGKRDAFRKGLLTDGDLLPQDWKLPLDLLKQSTILPEDGNPVIQRPYRTSFDKSPQLLAEQAGSAYKLKKPARWSQVTLTQYVKDIVSYKPLRRLLQRPRSLDPNRVRPVQIVARELDELLHKTSMRKHLTCEACHLAMIFFSKKSMLSKARKLFILIEHLSFEVETPAMNAMMSEVAQQKDLVQFTWLLQAMIRRGISPDILTWYYFIRCIEVRGVRRIILTDLQHVFPSIPHTLRLRFLRLTIGDEVRTFLENNSKFEYKSLFKDLQDQYGSDWLSGRIGTYIGNEIIGEMVTRIHGETMLQMLGEMTKHGFVPDEVTMLRLVAQCLRLRYMKDALKLTEYFHTQWNIQPGRPMHDLLAKHAWRHSLLNVSRLIWTSACFQAIVTKRMARRIGWSLRFSAIEHRSEASADLHPPRVSRLSGHKKPFMSLAGKFLLGMSPLESHSIETVQAAMRDNLIRAGDFRLARPIAKTLLQALAVDREWAIWHGIDVAAKVENPLPIEIEATPGAHSQLQGQEKEESCQNDTTQLISLLTWQMIDPDHEEANEDGEPPTPQNPYSRTDYLHPQAGTLARNGDGGGDGDGDGDVRGRKHPDVLIRLVNT